MNEVTFQVYSVSKSVSEVNIEWSRDIYPTKRQSVDFVDDVQTLDFNHETSLIQVLKSNRLPLKKSLSALMTGKINFFMNV